QRNGWPQGEPEVFLDLTGEGLAPDGAVCDRDGNLWLAEWGSARVSCYGKDGRRLRTVACGGRHSSCPAFGGADLTTLFVTTARQGLDAEVLAAEPDNGRTFAIADVATGVPEYRVML